MSETALPPLHNIRVLDLSRIIAGPMCSMMLGDLGATIIKIEPPDHGDDSRGMRPPEIGGESSLFLSANRHKQSVGLDIRTASGLEAFFDLLTTSDVLIENFRPGTTKRLGIDYPTLAARHPRLIYCSISGYGQTGSRSQFGGLDPVLQAETGMMSLNGSPNGDPMRHPLPLTDMFSAHYATQSILAALYACRDSGQGQHIDLCLYDVGVASTLNFNQHYLTAGENPPRLGNEHPSAVPVALFQTQTGPFYMAAGNDRLFQGLCEKVLDRPELLQTEKFATNPARVRHRDELMPLLQMMFSSNTRAHWLGKLLDAGIPAGPVRTVEESLNSSDVAERGMLSEIPHPTIDNLRLVNSPIRFSHTPVAPPTAPPRLGQHTEAVLREQLGYDDAKIEQMRQDQAIR